MKCRPHLANSRPRTAPTAASTMLSVSSWRNRRCRPAPRAVRTATSRQRPAARANCRLATLAQAIKSTKNAEPRSMAEYTMIRLPAAYRSNVHARKRRLVLVSGCSFSRRNAMPATSAANCAGVRPGFNRPTDSSSKALREGPSPGVYDVGDLTNKSAPVDARCVEHPRRDPLDARHKEDEAQPE